MTIVFEQHEQAVRYIGHSDFIDNEVSEHLDSSDAFEGPEKTLEIKFIGEYENVNLNLITVKEWTELLAPVECQILSRISDDNAIIDVYLLSESTLVVHGSKLMLKTCGTTSTLNLLDSIESLLLEKYQIKLRGASCNQVKVSYSRPQLKFPHKQKHIHQSWDLEMNKLTEWFGNGLSTTHHEKSIKDGIANANSWYLYQNGQETTTTTHNKATKVEIIMHGLSPEAAKLFSKGSSNYSSGHLAGSAVIENNLGLSKLFPGSVDAFSFAPCGWSANSVAASGNGDGDDLHYATAHVTPEAGWSYASYETTRLDIDPQSVLDVFQPASYCVVWH